MRVLHLKPIKRRYCISSLAFAESVLLSGSASALNLSSFKHVSFVFPTVLKSRSILLIGNRFQIGRLFIYLFMAFYFIESGKFLIFHWAIYFYVNTLSGTWCTSSLSVCSSVCISFSAFRCWILLTIKFNQLFAFPLRCFIYFCSVFNLRWFLTHHFLSDSMKLMVTNAFVSASQTVTTGTNTTWVEINFSFNWTVVDVAWERISFLNHSSLHVVIAWNKTCSVYIKKKTCTTHGQWINLRNRCESENICSAN